MKVTTVSASVRFSKALGDGQHKTVEVGAEATLDSQESWEEALAQLYADLGRELKSHWGNGNGNHKAQDDAVAVAEAPVVPEPMQTPAPTLEHYCQEHQTEFKKFEKDGRVWYSHKAGSTWCKEKA